MNRKIVLTTILIVTLSMLSLSFKIQRVEASGTIYIRADGSVEGTSYIQTSDNVTYVFTADIINDSVVVKRNDIIIDGNGHMLQGTGNGTGIDLSGRTNVTVHNATIKAFSNGIYLGYYSSRNMIFGNNITMNSDNGIQLYYSLGNNTVSGNNITANSGDGVGFGYSSSNMIFGNNIANNGGGIGLGHSSSNTISGNSITSNDVGIIFYYSLGNNTVSGNNITNNSYGVYLYYSSSNSITGNNFINNTNQTALYGTSINTWDDGYPSGGNYWSDYNGVDSNYDGIGDTPYVINTSNIDHYPLMGMFHSYNFLFTEPESTVTLVSNFTVSDFGVGINLEPPYNRIIQFYVAGESEFGFCRICIPHALMYDPYQVIIDNGLTEVLYFNETIHDNGTHRWIYFAYQHSPHVVTIIPEFPSFLILPLFMVATLLVAIIYRRKLVRMPD